MAKTPEAKTFTPMEREALIAQISDYMLFNMTNYEMYVALSKRFKRNISYGTIAKIKQEVTKRGGTADEWLDRFARAELSNFYRQRIEELQYVQKNLFQILDEEKEKGDKKNIYKYNQIAKTIIENSRMLADFGLAPPIISKIKELLPIDINELNQRVERQKAIANKIIDVSNDEPIKEDEEIKLDNTEQNELENIRQQARQTKTAFFLKRDNPSDRELSGDNKESSESAQQDEYVF